MKPARDEPAGAALLPDVCCVMARCNTGALATAGHRTADCVTTNGDVANKVLAW
ncbi:MAG: hypothetical protein KIT18_05990 [Burkholderiales bacterium]|nr:hypothetical protein [Burkholderiales bacterium]